MKRDWQLVVVPFVAAVFIRLMRALLRIRHAYPLNIERLNRSGKQYVLAFWHSQLLLMVYSRHGKPMTVMISEHRDGELIARTMRSFGIDSARGSTTRGGGAALREMLKIAERGENLAFTPDGPRGPRHIVQPGVVIAAQLTGNPIVPVVFTSRKKTLLKSWDRFEIPHPFSRALFVYGDPVVVPRRMSPDEFEQMRRHVEQEMIGLAATADRDFEKLWRDAKREDELRIRG